MQPIFLSFASGVAYRKIVKRHFRSISTIDHLVSISNCSPKVAKLLFLTAGNKSYCGTLQRLTHPQQSTNSPILEPVSSSKRQASQRKPSRHPSTLELLLTPMSHVIPPGPDSSTARKPRNINDPISNPETSSGELRAKLLRSWAAGPGRQHANDKHARRPPQGLDTHTRTTGAAGVKGAGGTGGHGRASRRGAERSEAA